MTFIVTVLDVLKDGQKVNGDIGDRELVIDLQQDMIKATLHIIEKKTNSGFFDLFKEPTKVHLLPGITKFSEWAYKFEVPEGQAANSIKKMGINGAIGFVVAGPLGAAAGAFLTNNDDIPIVLTKDNIVLNCKTTAKGINEIRQFQLFNS